MNEIVTFIKNSRKKHGLTQEELHELADYNIQLWMDLKAAVRKHGITNAQVFNQEASR